jgi:1-deoxy-D-xylulose-5-phosphate synthase
VSFSKEALASGVINLHYRAMTIETPDFTDIKALMSPDDLRQLSPSVLPQVASALRTEMIALLNQCGGHFAANLGAVELAIALHYHYETPKDLLVWDVGHQAYPHKMLTGRHEALSTIRQAGGLAPFPARSESPFDAFGTGHSSTAISAALGMLCAHEQATAPRAVAVIGDGGLTGGMAFEALNHAGALNANLRVVLNDNDMSISKNVGALTHYLSRLMTGDRYAAFRESSKKILSAIPPISKIAKQTEARLKSLIQPGSLFEELGFRYIGPIDGHDFDALLPALAQADAESGPVLLHVITKKGKGYEPAEKDPVAYHAVKAGFLKDSAPVKVPPATTPAAVGLSYSAVFGQWMVNMAAASDALVGITPAMCEGSGLQDFSATYPDRYYDVGIAEQHAVTFAAGLACQNKKPVVAIYSTFLQRAYDQLIHDVAIQNLDVTFAIDRAGIVGPDGATHAGSFDLSYLSCVPNLVMMAPADEQSCYDMLTTAYRYPGPAAVRYPRGLGPGHAALSPVLKSMPIGRGVYQRIGQAPIAILSFGALLDRALEVAETLDATVIDMRFIKPLDTALVREAAERCKLLVTLEDNVVSGGAGSAVNRYLYDVNAGCAVLNLGLPDAFMAHGSREEVLAACGLAAADLLARIEAKCACVGLARDDADA